ncbi:hypothetical protein ES708_20861 [subsurface metagenome]
MFVKPFIPVIRDQASYLPTGSRNDSDNRPDGHPENPGFDFPNVFPNGLPKNPLFRLVKCLLTPQAYAFYQIKNLGDSEHTNESAYNVDAPHQRIMKDESVYPVNGAHADTAQQ